MTAEPQIKIGVYGRTQAGKTRFLYELLRHWEKERRILSQTPSCQDFLKRGDSQIESYGGTKPTEPTSSQEDLTVTVQNPDDTLPTTFTFRDLRGELLEGEIDNLESLKKDGLIPQQVAQCDGFLFFFDPTSWEDPAQLAKHHVRELRRAEMFVEYVLSTRQNRFLPIVFLATRFDEWESDDDVRRQADEWLRRAHEKLSQLYDRHLAPHFPDNLVESNETCLRVTALRPETLDDAVEKTARLVGEGDKFRQTDRNRIRYVAAAASVFVTLLIVAGGLLVLYQPPMPPNGQGNGKPKRTDIPKQSEGDIIERLGRIDELLAVHPVDPTHVDVDDAKALNEHLKWLMLTATTEGVSTSEATQAAVLDSIEDIASAIGRQSSQEGSENERRLLLLSTYLGGIPDATSVSDALTQIQKKYWEIRRSAIAQELGSVMARRDQIGSAPNDCLKDLIEVLKTEETQVEQVDVFGPSLRKELLESIRTTQDFCEDRRSTGRYATTMRIVSARLDADAPIGLDPHAITIKSSGVPPQDFSLTPERIDERHLRFMSKKSSFDLEVGLGRSLVCTISSYDGLERVWNEKERVELVQGGTGPLVAIGMPLLRLNKPSVTKVVQSNGYEVKCEFSGFTTVPRLLWDAAERISRGESE